MCFSQHIKLLKYKNNDSKCIINMKYQASAHLIDGFKPGPVSWHFILPVRFSYLGLLRMRASILHSFSHAEQQYLIYLHYCKGRFRVVLGVHINKT